MATQEADDPIEASRMSLGAHLDELRRRLIYSAIAIFVCFGVCWSYNQELTDLLYVPGGRAVEWYDEALAEHYEQVLLEAAANPDPEEPVRRSDFFKSDDPAEKRLAKPTEWPPIATGAADVFIFKMKTCLYFSLFVAGSFLLYQMWLFIAAGLYSHEKKVIYAYLPFSVGLFLFGMAFGYQVTVPYAYYFVSVIGVGSGTFLPRLGEYWTFMSSLSLMMGVVFQLPILMIGLSRMDLVAVSTFAKYRGHFALVALIAAAIITPPDPYTQMMMAIPMVVLYELGIWCSRLFARRSRALAPVE